MDLHKNLNKDKISKVNGINACMHMNHINKIYAQRAPFYDYIVQDGNSVCLCIDCVYKAQYYEDIGYRTKMGLCMSLLHDDIMGKINFNQHVNTIVFKIRDEPWICYRCCEMEKNMELCDVVHQ